MIVEGLSEEYYRKFMQHLIECADCWKIYLNALHIINIHTTQTQESQS